MWTLESKILMPKYVIWNSGGVKCTCFYFPGSCALGRGQVRAVILYSPVVMPIGCTVRVCTRIFDWGAQIVDSGAIIYDLSAQIIDSGARIHDLGAQITDSGTRIYDLGARIIDSSAQIYDLVPKSYI